MEVTWHRDRRARSHVRPEGRAPTGQRTVKALRQEQPQCEKIEDKAGCGAGGTRARGAEAGRSCRADPPAPQDRWTPPAQDLCSLPLLPVSESLPPGLSSPGSHGLLLGRIHLPQGFPAYVMGRLCPSSGPGLSTFCPDYSHVSPLWPVPCLQAFAPAVPSN